MERAELAAKLGASPTKTPNAKVQTPTLICETEPQKFMAAFADAAAGEADVFLCDPAWGENERSQVTALFVTPPASRLLPPASVGWLCIPTGGSGGRLQFARHDQNTVAAAVNGFSEHFSMKRVNAVGVLPLHHVSGFMAWMRCVLTGGEYRHFSWKALEAGDLPALPDMVDGWVLSLVPTQLERLLRNKAGVAWLSRFRFVFLGGAPAWGDLLDRAAAAGIRLSPSYGMTETAAMVTALRPEDFLAGERSSGRALPHLKVEMMPDDTIRVMGRSVFRGYYPAWHEAETFETSDLGRFDERGGLVVIGRKDGVIISGGEKIQPAEVEAVLRDKAGLAEVVVVGLPHAEWGQMVVAAYPAAISADLAELQQLAAQLAPAKRPKHFLALESWPLTSAGKVNRAEVARLAGVAIRSGRNDR